MQKEVIMNKSLGIYNIFDTKGINKSIKNVMKNNDFNTYTTPKGLKELRIERNMKQTELADASGVSVFTISSVENGKATSLLIIIQ